MEQVPEPFDPQETEDQLRKLTSQLDELETGDQARPLHDFMQDHLMPMIATLQSQIATLTFYLGAHEDRISEIEAGEESQLLPEDAEELLRYLTKTVEIFESLDKEKLKLPGLKSLIEKGKELVEFVEQITLDAEDDPSEPGRPAN